MSSTTPTTEPEGGKSIFTTQPLPDDLPTLNRATSLAQNFGQPTAGNTDYDTGKTDAEYMDICEIISPTQQGGEDVPAHSQGDASLGQLNNQLVDIYKQNSDSEPPEDLPATGDWPKNAYTMALERQVEQLQRKVTLQERQRRSASGDSNAFRNLSQENARLTAENRRLLALVREMASFRERNEGLQQQIDKLSTSRSRTD